MSDDQLMTPEQLVEYLQLKSVQVIYKWNATGTGPAYFRVGRHIRFKKSEECMAGDATRRGIERAVKVGGFLGLKTSGNPRIMHKP
jgi:hypothetical protein